MSQEDMSVCVTRRHVFLWRDKECLLVTEDMSLVTQEETYPLVTQEEISSCDTRRHFFLRHKNTFLVVTQDMSACDACLAENIEFYHKSDLVCLVWWISRGIRSEVYNYHGKGSMTNFSGVVWAPVGKIRDFLARGVSLVLLAWSPNNQRKHRFCPTPGGGV